MGMVRSTPLQEKLASGRQPKTQIDINGVKASFGWAGSAASLAGETACKVIVDERDRMDDDVKGEGDPVEMADGRHITYPDGQTGIFSTPTIGDVDVEINEDTGLEHWQRSDDLGSASWKIWQEGTRHEWMLPCPDCGEYFAPRFRHLIWPADTKPKDIKPEDVCLACIHCGTLIPFSKRENMLSEGRAVAPGQWVDECGDVQGEPPFSLTWSLWTSGLVSPWRDWFTMCQQWLTAVASGDPTRIQTVLNVQFGELYSYSDQAPDWEIVAELRGLTSYTMGTLPVDNPICLVAGVDVQLDRLVYVVRAFCMDWTTYLVEHGEIYSDHGGTDAPDVWKSLALFKDRQFNGHQIDRCLIDSRYRTATVFEFVRRHKSWAFPAVGVDSAPKPITRTLVDINRQGKVIKGGLARFRLDGDYFKRWIHERVERDRDLPGQWHLPVDTTDDYCKQIVAEARIVKPSGKVVWKQLRKDNHYLDCEMMALAGAHSIYWHRKTDSGALPKNTVPGGRPPDREKKDGAVKLRSSQGPGSNFFRRRR
jgi:phage terminase large subunit GpA-like protein